MFDLKKIFAPLLIGGAMLLPSFASATTFDDCSGFALNINGGTGGLLVQGSGYFDCAFTVVGSDSNSIGQAVMTTYTATTGDKSIWVSGEWDYSTNDLDGSGYDMFGYLIGGQFFQLSTDGLPPSGEHEGTFNFWVGANTVFGWYITAKDNFGGSASAQVYANFAVPLPAGGLLLLSALGGLGLARRRRSTEPAIA